MDKAAWDRWSRGMGVVFAVLLLAAFIVFGEAPALEDEAEEVAAFYRDDAGRVLTGIILFTLSFVPLLWFVGAIAHALRMAGEGRLAATTIALFAAWVGAEAIFAASVAPLAVSLAENADPEVSQLLNGLGLSVDNVGAFPLAGGILAASVGLARSRLLPAWFLWFGSVASLLVALHATNWADGGFWSPGGGYLYIVVVAGLLWVVVASVLLFRAPLEGTPARPADVS